MDVYFKLLRKDTQGLLGIEKGFQSVKTNTLSVFSFENLKRDEIFTGIFSLTQKKKIQNLIHLCLHRKIHFS